MERISGRYGTRDRIAALKDEIAKAGVPTKAMANDLEQLERRSAALKSKHESLLNTQQRLFGQRKAGGIDTRNLAEHQRALASSAAEAANASRRLSSALETENQKMKRLHAAQAELNKARALQGKLASTGAGMAMGGAAISAAMGVNVANYTSLQEATVLLRTSMMDGSGKVSAAFDDIMKKAVELGNALPGTTKDFVEAARALKQQGMSDESVVNGGLQASAYLGVRFKMNQERAAEFIAKAREAHGLKDQDLPAAADYMHRSREAFGLRQDDIYESMKYAATDLNLKGQVGDMKKMKEYLVMQGMASQAGLEGSTFGTNFSHMLKAMASVDGKLAGAKGKEGQMVRDLMEEHKIKFNFYDGAGQFKGFENMMKELEKLNVLTPQEQERVLKKLFDTEGSRAAGILLKNGLAGFTQGLAKMENTASLNMVTAEMAKTLAYQSEAFKGNLENLSANFGKHLEPMVAASLARLNKVLDWLNKFNTDHPVAAANIMKTVAIIGTLLTVFGALTVGAAAILGPLAAVKFSLATLGIAGSSAGAGLMAVLGPIGKVIAAFTLGYTVGTLLATGIDAGLSKLLGYETTLGGATFDLVEKIKAGFGSAVDWVQALPQRMIEAGVAMIDGFIQGIQSRWEALKEAVGNIGTSSVDWVKEKLGIHSPSRVFAELGGFTMQGFEQGLAGSEDGPLGALSAMAKKLAGIGAGMAIGGVAMAGDVPADAQPTVSPASIIKQLPMPDGVFDAIGGMARKVAGMGAAAMAGDSPIGLPSMADTMKGITLADDGPLSMLSGMARRVAEIGAGVSISDPTTQPAITSPDRTPAPSAAPAGGNSYNITINAGPGSDGQNIAALVSREIQRIESQRSAQDRSRLRDRE